MKNVLEFHKEVSRGIQEIKGILEPQKPEALTPVPSLELNLFELGILHASLVRAHRQAQKSQDDTYRAYREANHACVQTYGALEALESHLELYQKRNNLTPMQGFEFVTIKDEKPEDDESA